MIAVCLVVAGVVRATLPGPDFTLAWEHSVAKTQWQESYRVVDRRLTLVEARVQGNGAGMESPPGALLHDGAWSWQPGSTHDEIRLTHSTYTRDYILCTAGRCAGLGDWTGATADGEVVSVRPCEPSAGGQQVGR